MNRIAKSALFACALAAFAVKPSMAQEEVKDYPGAPDPTSYGYTVLAIGIGTPFALPWGFDWDIFGLDLNFVYGDCNKMYGLELAGVANTARLDMLGLQASLAWLRTVDPWQKESELTQYLLQRLEVLPEITMIFSAGMNFAAASPIPLPPPVITQTSAIPLILPSSCSSPLRYRLPARL